MEKNQINFEKINTNLNNREPFPTPLVAVMLDHGFESLSQYLKSMNAPDFTDQVIEGLRILAGVLESRANGVPVYEDDLTSWAIGAIGRGVVEMGGQFIGPRGPVQGVR